MNDSQLRKEQEDFALKQLPRSPVVWIPQEPMFMQGGMWHKNEKVNFSSADEYGKIEIIWPGPNNIVFNRLEMEKRALDVAELYDEQTDYILALGSPTLIALIGWGIGQENKQIRMLEWDRGLRRYYPTFDRKAKRDGTAIKGDSRIS